MTGGREPKLTVPDLAEKKAAGERLSMVAVADFMTATGANRAGIDIVGVGDSAGTTVDGNIDEVATAALTDSVAEVAAGAFPDGEHSDGMSPDEAELAAVTEVDGRAVPPRPGPHRRRAAHDRRGRLRRRPSLVTATGVAAPRPLLAAAAGVDRRSAASPGGSADGEPVQISA